MRHPRLATFFCVCCREGEFGGFFEGIGKGKKVYGYVATANSRKVKVFTQVGKVAARVHKTSGWKMPEASLVPIRNIYIYADGAAMLWHKRATFSFFDGVHTKKMDILLLSE